MSVNKNKFRSVLVNIPIELDNFISTGVIQFFAHSHPDDGTTANLFPWI